jgi:hypothetical protein
MSEQQNKMDPFQLVALVIIVGAVFLGLYYTNLSVGTRFDAMETSTAGNAATLEMIIERLDSKVESLEKAFEAPSKTQITAETPETKPEGQMALAKAEGAAEEKKAADTPEQPE